MDFTGQPKSTACSTSAVLTTRRLTHAANCVTRPCAILTHRCAGGHTHHGCVSTSCAWLTPRMLCTLHNNRVRLTVKALLFAKPLTSTAQTIQPTLTPSFAKTVPANRKNCNPQVVAGPCVEKSIREAQVSKPLAWQIHLQSRKTRPGPTHTHYLTKSFHAGTVNCLPAALTLAAS